MHFRSTSLLAVVAGLSLLVVGCSQTSDGAAESERPEVVDTVAGDGGRGNTSNSDVAEPIDPCAGAPGTCQHVADVDVDGDGAADQVGVAFGSGAAQVIVGIDGRRFQWSQPLDSGAAYTDPADIYRGAFALSRAQGADLALHLVRGGGNAEQFAVISWDGSQLVALPQPPTADQRGTATEGIWYLGSSHGKQDSITCRTPGELAVTRLTAAMQEGSPVPGGGRREENYYLFSGGQWQPNGSDNVVDTSFTYTWDSHASAFNCEDLGTAP